MTQKTVKAISGRTQTVEQTTPHKPKRAIAIKNTICLWYNKDAEAAANFYAETFPDSAVAAVHHAPSDYPSGKKGDVLTVEFTICGIPCVGLNGGPQFKHSEAFSFQIATDDQAETDRLWNAVVGNGGQESQCGWCKDKWGVSWQITPRVLLDAVTGPDPAAAQRAFQAMMPMQKIDIAKIEAALRGLPHTKLQGANHVLHRRFRHRGADREQAEVYRPRHPFRQRVHRTRRNARG